MPKRLPLGQLECPPLSSTVGRGGCLWSYVKWIKGVLSSVCVYVWLCVLESETTVGRQVGGEVE